MDVAEEPVNENVLIHFSHAEIVLATPELVQIILKSVADTTTPNARALRELKSLSLVCKLWRLESLKYIFHTISLSSEDSVLRLLEHLNETDISRFFHRVVLEPGRDLFETAEIGRSQLNRRQILDVVNEPEEQQVYSQLGALPDMSRVDELEWAICQDWVPQSTPGVIRVFDALGEIKHLVLNTEKIFNLEQVKYLLSFCPQLEYLEIRKVPHLNGNQHQQTRPFSDEAANNGYNLSELKELRIQTRANCDWIAQLLNESTGGFPTSLRSLTVTEVAASLSVGVLQTMVRETAESLQYLSIGALNDRPSFGTSLVYVL
jgi:hypothetical protein